ncbi:MAG: response regulator transcription factor [Candidatus Pacebacteria bacterium]|nr:response regulator transcription factor [Candidatus Paceibacterota bacterium]
MRILLIEDDSELSGVLCRALVHENNVVDLATDGDRGSFLARTNEYDVIILDNRLPKKNGPEVCLEIRQADVMTPIIVTSVQSDVDQKISLLDVGADDYLTKPYSFEELLARIKAVRRRPYTIQSATMTIDDLTIDPTRQKVTRGKKDVYLTRKEFLLLECMMRAPGKVFSRGVIMEHVWDVNGDPFSNTIEAHIRNLRKKLEVGKNTKKLIHTVAGRGYKIDGGK